MIKKYLFILLCLCIFGCSPNSSIGKITIPIAGEEITLVWVDGGSFIMGSSELIANRDEKPTHKIHIDGANTILINSIRSIKKKLYQTITQNNYQIILIFEADIPQ